MQGYVYVDQMKNTLFLTCKLKVYKGIFKSAKKVVYDLWLLDTSVSKHTVSTPRVNNSGKIKARNMTWLKGFC